MKRLVIKSGNRLHLSDKPGQETVFLATPNHTSLSMTEHSDETGRQLVHLHSDGDIVLSAGGRVHIQSQFFSREIGSPGKADAAPAAAQASAATAPAAPAPAKEGWLHGFGAGLFDSTLKPLGHMIAHPIATVEGIGHALAHPVTTAKVLGHAVVDTGKGVLSGDGRSIGTALGTVGMLFVPGAGEAEGAEDAARLGQLGELSDVSKAGELVDSTSAVDKVASSAAAGNEVTSGTSFFGKNVYENFYKDGDVSLGAPGKPHFFMPTEDADLVQSSSDAARYTGMAPSVVESYKAGEPIYGMTFPTEGLEFRPPTVADAGGWPHFLEGGNTAVQTAGPDAGMLLNPTREFVTPGGITAPAGTTIFQLGENGERIPLRTIP